MPRDGESAASRACLAMDFYLLSGAGNDFIALVAPPAIPSPEAVRAWCRRGISVGADGVFVLSPTAGGARMRHWNADGGRGALCLNGSRCAAQLAFHLGWQEERLELVTDAGTLAARRLDETRVEIALPPIVGRPQARRLDAAGRRVSGFYLRVGVPHLVVPWDGDLGAAPLDRLGPILRAHPELGPGGANVDLVRFEPPHRLAIRTYERGVEAETLACGTGVVAAAATGLLCRGMTGPLAARTAGGFVLTVTGRPGSGRIGLVDATLAGDARLLARGTLLSGASVGPAGAAAAERPAHQRR